MIDPTFPVDAKIPIRPWYRLNICDRHRYNALRAFFRQPRKSHVREPRNAPFVGEIASILSYIDQPTPARDSRCVVCGLAAAGAFVCVNAQQLKHLIGRCKSSINSGFQQIDYDVVRNRAKARDALWAIIPEMRADQSSLRQWTVRCATDSSPLCFYSLYAAPILPAIAPADFTEEKRAPKPKPPPPALPVKPLSFEFNLVVSDDDDDDRDVAFHFNPLPEMQPSFSVDFLSGLDAPCQQQTDPFGFFETRGPCVAQKAAMPLSQPAKFPRDFE
jgi:hypothetical protein